MKKKIYYLVFIFFVLALKNFAQDRQISGNEIIERIAESYAENFSETTDLSPLFDDLERILETPININTATRSELEELHFLSTFQIENLLVYRKNMSQLYSRFELQAIDGFNEQLATDLAAFVVFLPPDFEVKSYLKQELNLRYIQTIEKVEGLIEDEEGLKSFAGIAPKLLLKYRAEKGNKFRFGMTAENDAGEEFFTGNNPYGFDFYSGYFGFACKKVLKEVYLGDYQVKTGQGLIQWSGYGKRKSIDANNVRTTGQGLKPYTSTDENNFYRGVATRFELGNFNIIAFYSNLNIDANIIETDSTGKPTAVSSIQNTGYHRTEGELLDRNAINAQTAGTNFKFIHKRFSIGLNGVFKKYSAFVEPDYQNYSKFNFIRNQNYNLSSDFQWSFNRINLFGEAAYSKSGGKALLTGFESQPSNELSISMVYRNYAKNFHTINGTAFSESSNIQNEKGIYTGLSVFPIAHVKVQIYIDLYESHWLTYNSNAPVKGTDINLQTTYTPNQKLEMYIRFKTERNSEKSGSDNPIKKDEDQTTTRARINLNWNVSEMLNFRFRSELSKYSKEDAQHYGILLFTDVIAKPLSKLSATARFSWFKIDNYDSRIYAYENDVPQYFYIPGFYSKGTRYYLNLKYELTTNLKLYFKISQTKFTDADYTIGSGNTIIAGNHRSDVKLHLKYRF